METISIWTSSLMAAMTSLWSEVAGFIPNLVAAAFILIVGYIIARLLREITSRFLSVSGVEQFCETSGISSVLRKASVSYTLSKLVSQVVFWLVMLLFLVSAFEAVGLIRMASVINDFILYLPQFLGAIAILLGGLYLAGLARQSVIGAAEGIGLDYAGALGTIVYGMVGIIVLSLTVGQLNLEIQVLAEVISIVLLSLGIATALAFGLGARQVAAHIIAGNYIKELYSDDDEISVGEVTGRIVAIGAVKTLIQTDKGDVSVSNLILVESNVTRKPG